DVPNLRVTVGSEIRPLEPKSFRLLLFLVENPGRALTKDDIMAAVWPDAIVSDNSLARAITQIRKVLEDDPKAPKYIETVPTVGSRFLAECREELSSAATSDVSVAPSEVHPSRWLAITAVSVAFGVLAIGAAWWMKAGRSTPIPPHLAFAQVTDQPGQELYPS